MGFNIPRDRRVQQHEN